MSGYKYILPYSHMATNIIKIMTDDKCYKINKKLLEKYSDCALYKVLNNGASYNFIEKSLLGDVLHLDMSSDSVEVIVSYMRGYQIKPTSLKYTLLQKVCHDAVKLNLTELAHTLEPYTHTNTLALEHLKAGLTNYVVIDALLHNDTAGLDDQLGVINNAVTSEKIGKLVDTGNDESINNYMMAMLLTRMMKNANDEDDSYDIDTVTDEDTPKSEKSLTYTDSLDKHKISPIEMDLFKSIKSKAPKKTKLVKDKHPEDEFDKLSKTHNPKSKDKTQLEDDIDKLVDDWFKKEPDTITNGTTKEPEKQLPTKVANKLESAFSEIIKVPGFLDMSLNVTKEFADKPGSLASMANIFKLGPDVVNSLQSIGSEFGDIIKKAILSDKNTKATFEKIVSDLNNKDNPLKDDKL